MGTSRMANLRIHLKKVVILMAHPRVPPMATPCGPLDQWVLRIGLMAVLMRVTSMGTTRDHPIWRSSGGSVPRSTSRMANLRIQGSEGSNHGYPS